MVKLYNSKVIGDLLPNVKQKVKPEQAKPIVLAIEEKKPTKTKKQGFANEKDIFLYNNKMENPTENKVEGESQPTKPENGVRFKRRMGMGGYVTYRGAINA